MVPAKKKKLTKPKVGSLRYQQNESLARMIKKKGRLKIREEGALLPTLHKEKVSKKGAPG